ncbi:MAG: hypothetical protein OEX18_13775 [Candidatus Krumholzibacteria bacterium]|nr:hypothetical protein [Candidatus Krumholzibacteria bacterium]MDH4338336.1 hypothetical protein [Candidatus Krumholzibacteria bacterium]MDH5270752.1 hypothetical protein [Candidatus Krumholzibacteria bacterium]
MVAAACLAATAPRVLSQDNVYNPGTATPDTLQFGKTYQFAPLFKNGIEGNVSFVSMMNQFNSNMSTSYGPRFDFGLFKDEKYYRLQDRREETKRLTLSSFYAVRPGMTSTLGYSDSRVFNRSVIPGGGFQDYIINDNGFTGGATLTGRVERARFDAALSASAMNGERTYKTDDTYGGGLNGGVGYNFFRNRLVVQARGALRETSESSRTALAVFNGLGASEDSVSGAVRLSLADSVDLRASYSAYNGTRTYADQAQGALGGQLGGAENVFEETENRLTRTTLLNLNSQLWDDLLIQLDASHEEQLSQYAVQTTRFGETVIDALRGTVTYMMPWKTRSVVSLDNSETQRNLGPQSVGSYAENRKRVGIGLGHQFTPTLRADFSASTQLSQSFYVNYEANPRDRDQVDNLASLRLSSQPFSRVSANVTVSYSSTQFINIDESQSRNNRTRDLYEMRPGFSWNVRDWFTISQTYGVVIEYTDYVFVPNDNFLDRNLIFANTFTFKPVPGLDFRFDYGLNKHDKGSYLPTGPNGEDVLNVDREDHRSRLTLRVDYAVNDRLAFFAENRYSQFVDKTVSSNLETVTTDGQIAVGTTGKYDFGKNRKLSFLLSRVKRFAPTGSAKEKDYWDMRSELNFPL